MNHHAIPVIPPPPPAARAAACAVLVHPPHVSSRPAGYPPRANSTLPLQLCIAHLWLPHLPAGQSIADCCPGIRLLGSLRLTLCPPHHITTLMVGTPQKALVPCSLLQKSIICIRQLPAAVRARAAPAQASDSTLPAAPLRPLHALHLHAVQCQGKPGTHAGGTAGTTDTCCVSCLGCT